MLYSYALNIRTKCFQFLAQHTWRDVLIWSAAMSLFYFVYTIHQKGFYWTARLLFHFKCMSCKLCKLGLKVSQNSTKDVKAVAIAALKFSFTLLEAVWYFVIWAIRETWVLICTLFVTYIKFLWKLNILTKWKCGLYWNYEFMFSCDRHS